MGSLNPENNPKRELDDSGYVQDDNTSKEAPAASAEESYRGTAGLLDLSDDVLLNILKYCSARDLKALGFTCARFAAVVLDRTLWARVDTRYEPSGKRRVRWLLTNALSVHTTSLKLCGYAREARGCLGFMSGAGESPPRLTEEELEAESMCHPELPPEDHRLYRLSSQSVPRDGDGYPLWPAEAEATAPLAPVPTGPGCPGPQVTLSRAAISHLTTMCSNLTELCLDYCVIDCHLAYGTCSQTTIGMFPASLRRLSLKGTKCFNLEKSFLYRIQDTLLHLEYLNVSFCEWVEPACMLPLSKMTRLTKLVMRQCPKLSEFVAYASLATRYGFKTLKILDLRGSPVGDSEVSALGWVPQLQELYLSPAARVAPVADHAHFARDPPPPHRELEPWEEQEPEYYTNKYRAEKWIREEENTNVDRGFRHAVGGEACVVLPRPHGPLAGPAAEPPAGATPGAPEASLTAPPGIEPVFRLRLGDHFRRIGRHYADAQGSARGPLEPASGAAPDWFREFGTQRCRVHIYNRPECGFLVSNSGYSRRNFHMYHGAVDEEEDVEENEENNGGGNAEKDAASGGEIAEEGGKIAEQGDKIAEEGGKIAEEGGKIAKKVAASGGENAEESGESDAESDKNDSDDSGEDDPDSSTRPVVTNEPRNQPGPTSQVTHERFATKAARKYYEDSTCRVSRTALKENWNVYRKRPVSGTAGKPDGSDDDDSSSDDDKPLVKRARVTDSDNNQGDCQPSTSGNNVKTTEPSHSSAKSNGSAPKSSGSAEKSNGSANVPSGTSTNPDSSTEPTPSSSQNNSNQNWYSPGHGNAFEPRAFMSQLREWGRELSSFKVKQQQHEAACKDTLAKLHNCINGICSSQSDRCQFQLNNIEEEEAKANLDSMIQPIIDYQLGRPSPPPQPSYPTAPQNVQFNINPSSPSREWNDHSNDQPSTSSRERYDQPSTSSSREWSDQPSTSSSRGQNDQPSTSSSTVQNDQPSTSSGQNDQQSTSSSTVQNDQQSTSSGQNDQPSTSSGGKDQAKDKSIASSDTTKEQNVAAKDAPSTSGANGAEGDRPRPQRFIRFRQNAAPLVYEGYNPYNNNDAQQPDWNRGPGRVARQMPLLSNMLDEPIPPDFIDPGQQRGGNAGGNAGSLPRHRVLYVNVGRRRHSMYQVSMSEAAGAGPAAVDLRVPRTANMNLVYSSHIVPRIEYTSLVTDAAIRRFGRADNDNINYVNIGPFGPVPAPYEDPYARPNRSNLRVLSATGYRHITNASLMHLMTAAPHLRVIDFSGTRVTQPSVERFRNARPECQVTYGPLDAPIVDNDL